jgi:hypothetical protein
MKYISFFIVMLAIFVFAQTEERIDLQKIMNDIGEMDKRIWGEDTLISNDTVRVEEVFFQGQTTGNCFIAGDTRFCFDHNTVFIDLSGKEVKNFSALPKNSILRVRKTLRGGDTWIASRIRVLKVLY